MARKSYVEFYGENKISPVNYQLASLEKHFATRKELYHYLGILPSHIKGRRVLEVGPGSGYNALYTASLKPAVFHMVEPNPTGVDSIKAVFGKYGIPLDPSCIYPILIQDFALQEPYDFVICEGMVGGQDDPHGMLKYLAHYVAPGGVLITTTVDPISFLADLLRRLLARLLIPTDLPLQDKVARLVTIFKPHLDTLKGMNRPYEDWVMDNLINPACTIGLLTIADCLTLLSDRFKFLGSSPVFYTDWTWYKTMTGSLNEKVLKQYWQNVHNLLDYRKVWPARSIEENQKLNAACLAFHQALDELENTSHTSGMYHIKVALDQLVVLTGDFAPDLAEALRGYLVHLETLDPEAIAADEKLGPWFGRGQQNISLCENSL